MRRKNPTYPANLTKPNKKKKPPKNPQNLKQTKLPKPTPNKHSPPIYTASQLFKDITLKIAKSLTLSHHLTIPLHFKYFPFISIYYTCINVGYQFCWQTHFPNLLLCCGSANIQVS